MGKHWRTWQRGLPLMLYAGLAGLLALVSAGALLAVVGLALDLLHRPEPGTGWLWIGTALLLPFYLGSVADYVEQPAASKAGTK